MDERTSSTKTNKVYKGKNIAKSNKRGRTVEDHNHPHPESPRYRVNLIMGSIRQIIALERKRHFCDATKKNKMFCDPL